MRNQFKYLLMVFFGMGLIFQGCEISRDLSTSKEVEESKIAKPVKAAKKTEKTVKTEPKTAKSGPKRALRRNFPEKTEFVKDGKANLLIVYGNENKKLAFQLRDELKKLTGVELPVMLDYEATGGKRWVLKDEVKNRNLLLLGNINDNRGVLALYAKFLAAASGKFPGIDKYVIRHLAEPFVPGKTALVLGASDKTGLKKAIERLLELLRDSQAENTESKPKFSLGFPLIEFGGAEGPLTETKGDFKFLNYADAAYVFYTGGRPAHCYAWFSKRPISLAIENAREFVIKDINSDNSHFSAGGHYDWMRNYQALRIIIAHGLLNARELCALEEKLLQNALANKDHFVTDFQDRRDSIMKDKYSPSFGRHSSSTAVGQYLLLDYLANFARIEGKTKSKIQSEYELFSQIISDWNRYRVFRGCVGDVGALDCSDFLIDAFMHLGLEDFVDNGMLRELMNFYLCNVSSLWANTGSDFYIGAYQGAHIMSPVGGLAVKAWAFFNRDYSLEKIDEMRFEKAGTYQRGFKDGPSRICLGQPDPFSLSPTGKAPEELSENSLMKTPPEPTVWKAVLKSVKDWNPKPAYSQGFNVVAFRDGWAFDDAFMSIKGLSDTSRVWNVNTINCFTEHGAMFLFGGSMSYESWRRSGITVDTDNYAEHAGFAIRVSEFSEGDGAIFASLCKSFNGSEWQRTIIRRKHGYFIVLDDITALRDGDFNLTATWRVFPSCAVDLKGVLRGTAGNGAHFAIIPDQVYPFDLSRAAVDGVSRLTFYRQFSDRKMKKGETVSFHNAIASAKKGESIGVKIERINDHTVLMSDRGGELALAGSRDLPSANLLPSGACAAFYMTRDKWMLGGVSVVKLGDSDLIHSESPADLIMDFGKKKAKIIVHDRPTRVLVSKELGGSGELKDFAVGEHSFEMKLAGIADFNSTVSALHRKSANGPEINKNPYPAIPGLKKLWTSVVQNPPSSVIRPVNVVADKAPATMATHNVYDGVFPTNSIPSPVWKVADLTVTLEQVVDIGNVVGVRIFGRFETVKVDVLNKAGEWKPIPFTESAESFFAGYSNHRVGSKMYQGRQLNFKTDSRSIRLKISAKDKANPSISISEIQLLGSADENEVWGRLKVEKFSENANSVLLCRTGTYADTVEDGGALQAFSLDGKLLWRHDEPAPSQYRDKYWVSGDIDNDGAKELVSYADDTVLRIYDVKGKLKESVDLHEWEEKNRKKLGTLYLGGKSLALWPKRPDGNSDVFVFGHVHHHQIQMRPKVKVIRRDREPNIECAPSASASVEGWTGLNSQNLVGVAPWRELIVLWESQGADKVPRQVFSRPLANPLVQLSANNQLPVFVECLKTRNPEGVLAVTPRGLQFFGKPDLKPGWSEAGMCPVSAAMVFHQDNGGADRVISGRENGRVLVYDVMSGKLLAENLLEGAVRRIAFCQSGEFVVGTSHGVFLLKKDLSVIGFMPCPLEDIALADKENERIVYVLSTNGELSAFKI